MLVYPGGNWLDRAAHGHRFFANYFCDLTQPVSLSGVNNPLGSRLAQLAMVCFAAALAGFFWLVPRHFAAQPRGLAAWVRGLGECAVLSYLAVPFTPSELFGDVHAWLSLLSGALGLSAALCAVWALLRSSASGARTRGARCACARCWASCTRRCSFDYLHATRAGAVDRPRRAEGGGLAAEWLDARRGLADAQSSAAKAIRSAALRLRGSTRAARRAPRRALPWAEAVENDRRRASELPARPSAFPPAARLPRRCCPRGENARISSPTRSAWLERAGSPLTRTWFASQAV